MHWNNLMRQPIEKISLLKQLEIDSIYSHYIHISKLGLSPIIMTERLTEEEIAFLLDDDVKRVFNEYMASINFNLEQFDAERLFLDWKNKLPEGKFSDLILPISPGVFIQNPLHRRTQIQSALAQISEDHVARGVEESKNKRIVIYTKVLHDGFGDYIYAIKIAEIIKDKYPDLTINIIVDVKGSIRVKKIQRILTLQSFTPEALSSSIFFILSSEKQPLHIRIFQETYETNSNDIIHALRNADLIIQASLINHEITELMQFITTTLGRKEFNNLLCITESAANPFTSYTSNLMDVNALSGLDYLSNRFKNIRFCPFGLPIGLLFDKTIMALTEGKETRETLISQLKDPHLKSLLVKPDTIVGSAYLRNPESVMPIYFELLSKITHIDGKNCVYFIKSLPNEEILKRLPFKQIIIYKKTTPNDELSTQRIYQMGDCLIKKPANTLHIISYALSPDDCQKLHVLNPFPAAGGEISHFQAMSTENLPFIENLLYNNTLLPGLIFLMQKSLPQDDINMLASYFTALYQNDKTYLKELSTEKLSLLTEQWRKFRKFLLTNYNAKDTIEKLITFFLFPTIKNSEIPKAEKLPHPVAMSFYSGERKTKNENTAYLVSCLSFDRWRFVKKLMTNFFPRFSSITPAEIINSFTSISLYDDHSTKLAMYYLLYLDGLFRNKKSEDPSKHIAANSDVMNAYQKFTDCYQEVCRLLQLIETICPADDSYSSIKTIIEHTKIIGHQTFITPFKKNRLCRLFFPELFPDDETDKKNMTEIASLLSWKDIYYLCLLFDLPLERAVYVFSHWLSDFFEPHATFDATMIARYMDEAKKDNVALDDYQVFFSIITAILTNSIPQLDFNQIIHTDNALFRLIIEITYRSEVKIDFFSIPQPDQLILFTFNQILDCLSNDFYLSRFLDLIQSNNLIMKKFSEELLEEITTRKNGGNLLALLSEKHPMLLVKLIEFVYDDEQITENIARALTQVDSTGSHCIHILLEHNPHFIRQVMNASFKCAIIAKAFIAALSVENNNKKTVLALIQDYLSDGVNLTPSQTPASSEDTSRLAETKKTPEIAFPASRECGDLNPSIIRRDRSQSAVTPTFFNKALQSPEPFCTDTSFAPQ